MYPFIGPIMEYFETVWNWCGVTNCTLLQKIRRTARLTTKGRRVMTRWRCIHGHCKKITPMNWRKNVWQDSVHSIVRIILNLNTMQTYDKDTSQSDKIHSPRARKKVAKHSFYYNKAIQIKNFNFSSLVK